MMLFIACSLGTVRSVRPLSPDSEVRLEQILLGLVTYYKYRGVNLRTSCEDFDRHHIGVINETQVYMIICIVFRQ